MDSDSPIRFAVVGCGMLAQSQHLPNIAGSAKARLQVCCDLSDDRLAECARFDPVRTSTDFHAEIASPDVDAVCIATTERVRLPIIRAAAEAGKAVYCEKPVARTLEELYAIEEAVLSADIPFCAGHNRRCAPAMIDAHRIFRAHMVDPGPCPWRFDREKGKRPGLADDGAAAMSVRINDDWYSWKGWVFDPEDAPWGPMLFEMVHFTDLCNWFMDTEPIEVVALESGMLNHGVVIRYSGGEVATILMAGNGTFGYPKELCEMFGNGGTVVVDHMLEVRTAGIADAPPRTLYPMLNDRFGGIGDEGGVSGWLAKRRAACAEADATGEPERVLAPNPDKGHAHALDRFVDEIRGGAEVCGIRSAVLATRVAFAAVRAASERRVVSLAET